MSIPISMVVVTERMSMRWSPGSSSSRNRFWNHRSMLRCSRRSIIAVCSVARTGYGSGYPDSGDANRAIRRKKLAISWASVGTVVCPHR